MIGNKDTVVKSDNPVATVNGKTISFYDWMDALRLNEGEAQLKKLVDQEVVSQLAHKKHIIVDDKVINREIAHLTTMQPLIDKEEMNKLEKIWRKDILYRYQLQALLTMDTPISEEKVNKYYAKYPKQYDFSPSVQISHIVVEKMETAKKITNELEQGASFSLLAREYSIDQATADSGGYLGYFTKNSQFLPKGYFDHALNMKEYSYSEPFASNNGVAIIFLHRYLPGVTFTFDEIKPYIKSELALEEMGQILNADPLWDLLDVNWIYEKD